MLGALRRVLLPLLLLVLVPPEVHYPAHRRNRVGSDLNEVESAFGGCLQGLSYGNDSELLAVGCNESHLSDPDLLIDPGLILAFSNILSYKITSVCYFLAFISSWIIPSSSSFDRGLRFSPFLFLTVTVPLSTSLSPMRAA